MKTFKKIPAIIPALIVLIAINFVATQFHKRYDLTQDKRYTLSDPAKAIIAQVKSPLIIDVFLEGELQPEFRKLQNETRYLLEEISNYNPNVSFAISNPVEDNTDANVVAQQFASFGMTPLPLTVKRNGEETTQTLFPWATANHNGKAIPISLIKNIAGASREQFVYASIQNLEYAFIDGFNRLLNAKSKRIAVLKDNGELPDAKIADMFRKLGETYSIAPFPMSTVSKNPERALRALQNTFDLVVVAKPTKAFTDEQKFVLDQYILNGGNSLWLIDAVAMENDSLRNPDGKALAFPRNLNLNDQFFKYGIRINPVLVKDLYSAPLSLASGDGSQSKYQQLPWFYQPVTPSFNTHPINTNIERPVRFNYANQIELLNNTAAIEKTVLLTSSILTKIEGTPKEISLDEISIEPNEQDYQSGTQPLAVLLEGKFESAFKNRIQPVTLDSIRFRESATKASKMVVIADGDLIANEVDSKGNPLELGFDYFTRKQYGNKEFLLNTVNYLLDDNGLINIRSKEIALPFLDTPKVVNSINKWQALTIGLPLALLLIFGALFFTLRKRKYAR
ncbi:gliding motility-associated ABC transporter substrate-binding protein GldG [Dokdonia pacifica]|uniref:Protein involved in gliding motility GldG n=1 Tax=Dokdonia pacifica TaxID=1627892 RepID=A0A238YTJ6_9FLAO|nr:gliding motility-associated ABC transporter substrate-binding protein GldG [Dokdonia pacifica]GGG10343.1 gliding motility-associated ABC transporter substrate-binding protein GldG [Dokdonia pacifica]SNR74011.1 protein involved in gliding motility GldG [Dokdonia pacifica]